VKEETKIKISIIIVNYNVRYFLQQCLFSVRAATKNIAAEVFVVDNNSTDGSIEMLQETFPEVVLIANQQNVGFSKANNQAIKIAKGDYILLLNPDTVVEETTFTSVCNFMDEHNDAGGLGVLMIDGKGNFLPESKRGLPTPQVALYKISGLSALFPKSKTFGRYHLGYLDKNKTHEVDVLSGAFMLLRKSVIEKIGMLDEEYFMYGEDIDLSYRITLAGYKNYYYSGTKIIHYKGESTKKTSVNYVFVFYKAMVIFAKKHFAPGNAALFSFLINLAIWLRAGAAIIQRFISRIWLPLVDAAVIFAGMILLKNYWEYTVKDVHYPAFFVQVVVPIYIAIWLASAFLGGGYDKPIQISRLVRGFFTGTIAILVVYALLPETYRFSRALILLGTVWACLSTTTIRLILSSLGFKDYKLAGSERKKLLIIGDALESQRILSMLMMNGSNTNFVGYLTNVNWKDDSDGSLQSFRLGDLNSLNDMISIYEINEVIFCGKNISSKEIIDFMQQVMSAGIDFKIAPPESLFIIGSNSINEKGDFYLIDVPTLNNPINRRNKKIFDLISSVTLLVFSPILFLFSRKSIYFTGIFNVLFRNYSWVGLDTKTKLKNQSPQGIFSPSSILSNQQIDDTIKDRLNALYAKEYRVYNDFKIVLKGLFNN
jgi:GT2 family glycosyltransferase